MPTPDDVRGRVNVMNMVFIDASNELGEFRAGISAWTFGAMPAVIIGGGARNDYQAKHNNKNVSGKNRQADHRFSADFNSFSAQCSQAEKLLRM